MSQAKCEAVDALPPLPSWPDPLFPQHLMPPFVVSAQVCADPAVIALAYDLTQPQGRTILVGVPVAGINAGSK